MSFINKLENNTIIVTNYFNKLNILRDLNSSSMLYNINFISMEELIKRFYFSYDENAIYYLMNKYKVNVDTSLVYLKNLYYIDIKKNYNNSKLNSLRDIKKDLIDNKLLMFDDLFLNYIKNKKIIFYNYNYFTKLEINLIKKLEDITDVLIISKEYEINKHDVLEFNSMYDEVEFVAKEILKLIEKGVSVSNIKITNLDNDYIDIINSLFKMYNLKIDYFSEKLISTFICQEYLSMNGDIKDRVDLLSSKYKNNRILDKIIDIVNKYIGFDNEVIVNEMIRYEFKNTLLPQIKTKNMIQVVDYKEYPFSSNDYVFMLNFNQNKIPAVYKDEDYIPDKLKDDLLCDTSLYLNKMERESSIKNILNIKNLIITYKISSPFNTFYPSNLISDLNFDVYKKKFDLDSSYSDLGTKIRLSKMLDNYIKTGSISSDLKFLYSNYSDISYSKYNHKYKSINKDLLKEYLDSKLTLSYSSMDNYYKCAFRYYLANVLKLDIYEEKFEAYVGSLVHYVLEKALSEDGDINSLIDEFILKNDRDINKKEEFFIQNLKKDIQFVVNIILDHMKCSNFNDMLFEEKIEIKKNTDFSIVFKGFIDKIVYEKKNDLTNIAIIDYKTGSTDINLGYVPYGLFMQLPVYLYLAKNSNKLNNIRFAGFYLQRVLNNEVGVNYKKSYDELKRENVLLYGYSNSDQDLLSQFDNTYKNSRFIKSMRLDKSGNFSRYSKVLNDKQIDNLIKITDKKIDEAIKNICLSSFEINPKRNEKEVLGCKFCNFKDICFKEYSDEVLVEEDKSLSFLGGDMNA